MWNQSKEVDFVINNLNITEDAYILRIFIDKPEYLIKVVKTSPALSKRVRLEEIPKGLLMVFDQIDKSLVLLSILANFPGIYLAPIVIEQSPNSWFVKFVLDNSSRSVTVKKSQMLELSDGFSIPVVAPTAAFNQLVTFADGQKFSIAENENGQNGSKTSGKIIIKYQTFNEPTDCLKELMELTEQKRFHILYE